MQGGTVLALTPTANTSRKGLLMTAETIYKMAAADRGRTPVGDLANSLGLRTPNFITQAIQYAQEHGLPIPKFCFHRKKPGAAETVTSRKNTSLDIRLSSYKLSAAGLGNVLHFDAIPDDSDPENPRLIIQAAPVERHPATDVDDDPVSSQPETPAPVALKGRTSRGPTEKKQPKTSSLAHSK